MSSYTIKIKGMNPNDPDEIKTIEHNFHKPYLNEFKAIKEDYEIITEVTVTCLIVSRKCDLFGPKERSSQRVRYT